jgi:hypothetical protein
MDIHYRNKGITKSNVPDQQCIAGSNQQVKNAQAISDIALLGIDINHMAS